MTDAVAPQATAGPQTYRGRLRLARWAEGYYAAINLLLAFATAASPNRRNMVLLFILQAVATGAIATWLPRRSRAALFGALLFGALGSLAFVPVLADRIANGLPVLNTVIFFLAWAAQVTVLCCCLSIPAVRAELRGHF